MSYEYPTQIDVLVSFQMGDRWAAGLYESRRTNWTSPDGSVLAVVRHATELHGWDQTRLNVSDGLQRRSPVGENL